MIQAFIGFTTAFGQNKTIEDSINTTLNQSVFKEEIQKKDFQNSLGDLNIKLDDTGEKFIKFGLNSQVWLRNTENNPGTLVNGVEQKNTYDVGLRRMRITTQAQLSPAYQIFVQFGINNQSFIAGGGTGRSRKFSLWMRIMNMLYFLKKILLPKKKINSIYILGQDYMELMEYLD